MVAKAKAFLKTSLLVWILAFFGGVTNLWFEMIIITILLYSFGLFKEKNSGW